MEGINMESGKYGGTDDDSSNIHPVATHPKGKSTY
jgi:hypothetical protein